MGLPLFYKHAAPLGLWVRQNARPTGVGVYFITPYRTSNLGYPIKSLTTNFTVVSAVNSTPGTPAPGWVFAPTK